MSKNIVFIELGGNVNDRLNLITESKKQMQAQGCNIIQQSSIYETPPWGFMAKQSFYNQIVKVETSANAFELILILQGIEKNQGRIRSSSEYESRTMDLDILFFNNAIIKTNELTVPHPRLHLRNFVLVPMNEIAPNHLHPVLNKTIAQLLTSSNDNSVCLKISDITP